MSDNNEFGILNQEKAHDQNAGHFSAREETRSPMAQTLLKL
jgi:hypothetical protein